MTDTALDWCPTFRFGAGQSVSFRYPLTRWNPGGRTVGQVLTAAEGQPGPSLNLRRYTLATSIRYHESEWDLILAWLTFAQSGAPFEIVFEVDGVELSRTVQLDTPLLTTAVTPARDATLLWLFTLPIVLSADTPWSITYFRAVVLPSTFVATGGTIVDANGFRSHIFTDDGTFTVQFGTNVIEYLVVAGGGGGGDGQDRTGGGGGGGGVLHIMDVEIGIGDYLVTVGLGGHGGLAGTSGATNGEDSSFLDTTTIGGGHGKGFTSGAAASGGSGGGATHGGTGALGTDGEGHAGADHGFDSGMEGGVFTASGGGGAESAGIAGTADAGGNGGDGYESDISGESLFYGGGGGGSAGDYGGQSIAGGSGGLGGGGNGATALTPPGTPVDGDHGVDGLGGGGGGGARAGGNGGDGGLGSVTIRYPHI